MSLPEGRPRDSLVKYDPPLDLGPASPEQLAKGTGQGSIRAQLAKKQALPQVESKPNTDDILHACLPPREWAEQAKHFVQYVSAQPATRLDVIQLQEALDQRLMERQARETGICPVRGLLLLRVRDEIKMTIAAYQTLYQSSVTFGTRKHLQAEHGKAETEQQIAELEEQKKALEARVVELKNKCEAIERREAERRAIDERKRKEELDFLKHQGAHLETFLKNIDQK